MAVVVTTNGSQEELEADFSAYIEKRKKDTAPPSDPAAAEVVVPADPAAAAPGEETPAATPIEGKTTPEPAPGGKTSQEAAQAPPAGEPSAKETDEQKKQRGGTFQKKAQKLEAQIERYQQDLELERGSKTRLERQLAEAQAELERLKPTTAAAEPAKPAEPVKPKRPQLKDFEFDDEKFQAALDKYEGEDLPKYYEEVSDRRIAAKLEEDRQQREQAEADARVRQQLSDFERRRDTVKAEYADYEEVTDAIPEEIQYPTKQHEAIVERFLSNSDSPADLLYHFGKDFRDNGGAEFERLMSLPNDFALVRELTRLEDRLVAERTQRKTAGTAPPTTARPAATAPVAQQPPAQQRRAPVVPQAPIEPVGSRTSQVADTLEAAAARGDARAYRRLRDEGINR